MNNIYICNECNKKYYTPEEPIKCSCGADNFGIHINKTRKNINTN